jgi:hypothetical protein
MGDKANGKQRPCGHYPRGPKPAPDAIGYVNPKCGCRGWALPDPVAMRYQPTSEQYTAIEATVELWNALNALDVPAAEIAELCPFIHRIQDYILALVTRRSFHDSVLGRKQPGEVARESP